mmetsp:Transcript_15816/g.11479  ORF Transcript_15816/g.11479 Transcript_15816/m.11479 type:complete len:113 (-) Transcript_15816:489-827(-)
MNSFSKLWPKKEKELLQKMLDKYFTEFLDRLDKKNSTLSLLESNYILESYAENEIVTKAVYERTMKHVIKQIQEYQASSWGFEGTENFMERIGAMKLMHSIHRFNEHEKTLE